MNSSILSVLLFSSNSSIQFDKLVFSLLNPTEQGGGFHETLGTPLNLPLQILFSDLNAPGYTLLIHTLTHVHALYVYMGKIQFVSRSNLQSIVV